jgi:hypothetical protein
LGKYTRENVDYWNEKPFNIDLSKLVNATIITKQEYQEVFNKSELVDIK